MDFIESHFEDSKQAIIDRVKKNFSPVDTDQNALKIVLQRLTNISESELVELANERLKDLEEKLKNLGFNSAEVEQHAEVYKERLVEFLTTGFRKYLFIK